MSALRGIEDCKVLEGYIGGRYATVVRCPLSTTTTTLAGKSSVTTVVVDQRSVEIAQAEKEVDQAREAYKQAMTKLENLK